MSTASLQLATALADIPVALRSEHVMVEIQRAYHGPNRSTVGKREAVLLAFKANMERGESTGKGYKSGKRCALIATLAGEEVARINRKFSNLRAWRFSDATDEMRTEGHVHA